EKNDKGEGFQVACNYGYCCGIIDGQLRVSFNELDLDKESRFVTMENWYPIEGNDFIKPETSFDPRVTVNEVKLYE
ncbi:hypothetical protein HMI56_006122, partial [Coelomomyces lativittatus]